MPDADSGQSYVFISYASADRDRVLPIVDRLEAAGIKTWIDRDGIHGGASYALEIAEAIEHAAALVLMCSPSSLTSRNVKQEIALGWRFERPYLPLLLDHVDIPKDVAYWLEAAQWVEILDRHEHEWMDDVSRALERHGIDIRLIAAQTPPTIAMRVRPLLVGHEKEQAQLREQLDRMLAGRGGTVLVGGDAGIGKTTLVEDLSIETEERGALVLWGHAYDLSVTPPYGPWLEIFRHYRATADPSLPQVPSFVFDAEELAKVGSQETLFVTVADFFTAVAAQRPLVLVLDDLHWFDRGSLDFFRFLARDVASHRLLLIATYRSDELHRRHPLYTLLPLLIREAGAVRVDVHPLDDDGRRALIQQRYALVAPELDRLERYLADHAEGNPLYAGELLRTLEDQGVLRAQDGAWRLGELERVRVPPMLRQVIEGRLARLDDDTRNLLQIAAVIGQEVPLDLWQTVSDADAAVLVTAMKQGQAAQLIEEGANGSSYSFRHALLREALYEEIIALQRRMWHRQVAEALIQTSNPDPDRVAHHFEQAGDARVAQWLIEAGKRAQREYVWSTAAERYDAALAKMSEQGAPLSEQAALLYRIATMLRYEDTHRALTLMEMAQHQAALAGELAMSSYCEVHSGLYRCYEGDIRVGMETMERGVTTYRALSDAERSRPSSLVDEVWEDPEGTLVLWLAVVGRLEEARSRMLRWLAEFPVPKLRPGQAGSRYADGLLGLALADAQLGHVEAARRTFKQARDAYHAIEHHGLVIYTCRWELDSLQIPYETADRERRTRLADEGMAAARRAIAIAGGDRQYMALPLLVLQGDWADARDIASLVFERDFGARLLTLDGGRYRALLSYLRGDVAAAKHVIAELMPEGAAHEPGNTQLDYAIALQRLGTEIAIDAMDLPSAHAWLEAHDRWLQWSGSVLWRAEGALLWARYYYAADDTASSRRHAERALAHASDPRQPLALIEVHRFLGQLDTKNEQFDSADEHLQQSLRLAEACGAPFERALTLLEIAKLRAAQGQIDEARSLVAEVRSICEPLEAKPTLEKVTQLERRLASAGTETTDA